MVEFKTRLQEALQVRNMTAADLSRKSGIDKGSLSNYLKGKFIPKQSKIDAMARALNVSPAWLLGYDVDMNKADVIVEDSNNIMTIFENLSQEDKEKVKDYAVFLLSKSEDNK